MLQHLIISLFSYYFLLLAIINLPLNAQTSGNVRSVILAKEQAYTHIEQLKDGILLVRLQSKHKNIAAYKAAGYHATAQKVANDQLKHNQHIVKIFKANFDFCPIYFFYAKDTDKLYDPNTSIFLDDQLNYAPTISPSGQTFYIAEMTALKDSDLLEESGDNKPKNYHVNTTLQRVIVIKDAQLQQLSAPFPFYIKTTFDQFAAQKVDKWNKRLHLFYDKSQR